MTVLRQWIGDDVEAYAACPGPEKEPKTRIQLP